MFKSSGGLFSRHSTSNNSNTNSYHKTKRVNGNPTNNTRQAMTAVSDVILPNVVGDDYQTNTYCFGGVTYQNPARNNKSKGHQAQKKMSTKDFDPFYDRGKFRTKRINSSIPNEEYDRRSNTVHGLLKVLAAPLLNKDLEPYEYENTKLFSIALEVYNRKAVSEITIKSDSGREDEVTWSCTHHWVSQGRVRAGNQLCIQCRDLGKPRSYMEKYFLNTLEVSCLRTILCEKCMSVKLKYEVGDDKGSLVRELSKLREEQVTIDIGEKFNGK